MDKKFFNELCKSMPKMRRELMMRHSNALTKGEITIPQMILLEIVNDKKMCTVSYIAKNMGITLSAVTGLADRLVRVKLITRARGINDRRLVLVSLTEKGKNVLNNVLSSSRDILKKSFEVLTAAEQEEYLRLIKKIYSGLMKK